MTYFIYLCYISNIFISIRQSVSTKARRQSVAKGDQLIILSKFLINGILYNFIEFNKGFLLSLLEYHSHKLYVTI